MKAGGECGPRGSPSFLPSFPASLRPSGPRLRAAPSERALRAARDTRREAAGPRRGGQLGWDGGGAGRGGGVGAARRGAAVGPEPRRAEMRQCPLRGGCRRSLRGREPSRALGDRREALRASAGRLPRGKTRRSGVGRLRTVRSLSCYLQIDV